MSDGTGIENVIWLVERHRDQSMDRDLLRERLEKAIGGVLNAWDEFGPDAAPVLRMRYGPYIIVVGVEFAKEDDEDE
jgi:hypothetical protein